MTLVPALPLLAPLPVLVIACLAAMRPGRRPGLVPVVAEAATLVSLLFAVLVLWQVGTAAGASVLSFGPLILQADLLGATMLVLVSFVGWVVVRYSRSYVDGKSAKAPSMVTSC